MRSQEFLNEIERTPAFKNDWGLDQEPLKVDEIPKGSKKFPGYPNFVYYDVDSAGVGWKLGNYRTVVVIDRRNRNLVAKLTTQPTGILPGAVEESSVNVFDPYQRQGIAASLYHLIVVDRNTPIIADREGGQTPEARKLWVGLWQGRMPDIVVKGYVTIDIDNYFFQDIEKTVINYIMKLGGQWLYRTPKKWVVAFDMMPNRAESELTAAIQNELSSKVYHSEQFQGSDLFDDSGLIAMSTAKWEKLTGYSPE